MFDGGGGGGGGGDGGGGGSGGGGGGGSGVVGRARQLTTGTVVQFRERKGIPLNPNAKQNTRG